MEVTWEERGGAIVMRVAGEVDGSNFEQLIEAGRKALDGGTGRLLLDLSGCGFMSSAGLVALHSLALLSRGEEPPDPERGWAASHALGQGPGGGREASFKLVGPQPAVLRSLEKTGMTGFLDVFDDLDAALASF